MVLSTSPLVSSLDRFALQHITIGGIAYPAPFTDQHSCESWYQMSEHVSLLFLTLSMVVKHHYQIWWQASCSSTMYHGTDWTDRNVPKRPMQYACPSLPIVPWDGLDRMGTSQSVPCSIPYPSYPSHPIVPLDRLDRLGTCGVIVLLNKLYTMKSITGSLCNYYALLPGLSAPLNQIAPDL